MKKREIEKILREWWNDSKTCSGKPHCDVEKCDLCFTCFLELCKKFGLNWEASDMLLKNENKKNIQNKET